MNVFSIVSYFVFPAMNPTLTSICRWHVDVSTPGLPPGARGIPFFYNFFDVWKNKVGPFRSV